jgi:hypothetical protein
VKLQSVPPSSHDRQSRPGGTIGPAFAAPGVAAKARADKAAAEAIAIIEIVFMVGLQSLDTPTVQMVSHTCGCDYRKIHAGLAAPIRGIDRHCVGSHASGLAASIALKEEFSGTVEIVSYLHVKRGTTIDTKDTAMKLTTIALASAFALSGTAALANTVHHKWVDRDAVGMVQLHPNYGNPNGNPDGPTTLSGTGDSSFGGSSPGTSGYN